jgi:uncharacterized protein (DUF1778 family)
MPRPATKTALLTFRVAPEVRATLERAAKEQRRSLTNMLEVIVLEWGAAHPERPRVTAAKKKTTSK